SIAATPTAAAATRPFPTGRIKRRGPADLASPPATQRPNAISRPSFPARLCGALTGLASQFRLPAVETEVLRHFIDDFVAGRGVERNLVVQRGVGIDEPF